MRRIIFPVAIAFLILLCGCPNRGANLPRKDNSAADVEATSPPLIPLRVLVVDDTQLGQVAAEEWRQHSGSDLEMIYVTSDELSATFASENTRPNADIIIYPSRLIGEFIERGLIASMPNRFLSGKELAVNDILPQIRSMEMRWGNSTYAVPFGTAPPVLCYRRDRLAEGRLPPSHWEEFDRWLGDFGPSKNGVTFAVPLAKGWAAPVLLARAAAYVRQSGQVSTIFDFQNLEPLIDQAPYVRALEELVADLGDNRAASLEWNPRDVCNLVLAGGCDVCWTWMTKDGDSSSIGDAEIPLDFSELPGSASYYSFSNETWETRRETSDSRATFLGHAGRLGSVVKNSRREFAAWNLLIQMTSGEMGMRISSASHWTAPFRLSQFESTDLWLSRRLDPAAIRKYGAVVKTSFTRRNALVSVRLPGQAAYMQALDDAVRDVVAGKKQAEEALTEAAEQWRQITERLGRERQTQAFSRSLGIDP